MPRLRVLLAPVLALPLLAACRAFSLDGMEANRLEKPDTLEPWRAVSIGGVPATEYLLQRSAVLVVGADGARPGDRPRTVRPTLRGADAKEVAFAAACAVYARGYWLTAAHCVDEGPLLLVTSDGREVRAAPARVVWSGWSATPALDLALLHADGAPFGVLAWPARVPEAVSVLCAGSGFDSERFSAGRILRVGDPREDARCRELLHDAPLVRGDSGGPAMLADGSFAGVDVLTEPRYFGAGRPSSTALLPDERFVRARIEADVARTSK